MSTLSLPSYVELYFNNTMRRRKMTQRIRLGDNPSKRKIAQFAGCKSRAVFDFFKAFNTSLFLKVEEYYDPDRGDQESNTFTFEPGMIEAMDWMDKFGYLNSPTKKKAKILKHAKQYEEKRSKLHGGVLKTAPLLKDSSKDKEKETKKEKSVWINPILQVKDLDRPAQLWAMKHASDHEMQEAIESCRWKMQHGGNISNPSGYFLGTLKNKIKLRPTV